MPSPKDEKDDFQPLLFLYYGIIIYSSDFSTSWVYDCQQQLAANIYTLRQHHEEESFLLIIRMNTDWEAHFPPKMKRLLSLNTGGAG